MEKKGFSRKDVPLPSASVRNVLIGILLFCMILGSFLDLPVSSDLYHADSRVGMFFSAFGEYPASLGFVCAGTMLWCAGRSKTAHCCIPLKPCGVCFALIGIVLAAAAPFRYLGIPLGSAIAIAVVCSTLVSAGIFRISQNADGDMLIRVAVRLQL